MDVSEVTMDVTELIINLVRENECLYSKTNADYKNVAKKKYAYQVISQKLRSESGIEITAENIEKRWASLRDMFSRAHRKQKLEPSGSGYAPTKKWDLYDSMSFLTPHITHRRTKSNFMKPASTEELDSAEVVEEDEISEEHFAVPQSRAQAKAEPVVYDTSQPVQSFRGSTTQPQLFEELARIFCDHDYEVAEACRPSSSVVPLTPSATISSGRSSSSSSVTTPVFRPIQKPSIVPNLDHFAKRRRKSSTDTEKGIDAATQLLGKVVDDMVTSTPRKDPYLLAVEEGLKHVPAADKTKCLIEILQIIDKYQKF